VVSYTTSAWTYSNSRPRERDRVVRDNGGISSAGVVGGRQMSFSFNTSLVWLFAGTRRCALLSGVQCEVSDPA